MVLSNNFVLVGSLEGQTLHLGGHDFIKGVYEFVNVLDGLRSMPSQDDIKLKAISLERNYQAFVEGSDELANAQKRFKALKAGKEVEPEGSTPEQREKADEHERSEKVVTARATATAGREALLKLDPKNDEHWTQSGLPSVEAIRAIAGIDTISRADITALAPKLTREEAAKIASGE